MPPEEFRPIENGHFPWGTVGLLIGVGVGLASAVVGARALKEREELRAQEVAAMATPAAAVEEKPALPKQLNPWDPPPKPPWKVPSSLSFPLEGHAATSTRTGSNGTSTTLHGSVTATSRLHLDEFLEKQLASCGDHLRREGFDGDLVLDCASPTDEASIVRGYVGEGAALDDASSLVMTTQHFIAAAELRAEGPRDSLAPAPRCGMGVRWFAPPVNAAVGSTGATDDLGECEYDVPLSVRDAFDDATLGVAGPKDESRWKVLHFEGAGVDRYKGELVQRDVYWRVDAIASPTGHTASVRLTRYQLRSPAKSKQAHPLLVLDKDYARALAAHLRTPCAGDILALPRNDGDDEEWRARADRCLYAADGEPDRAFRTSPVR